MKINKYNISLVIRTIGFLSISLLFYMIISIDWESSDIGKRDIKPFIVYAVTYYHPAADRCNAETCATSACSFCSENYKAINGPQILHSQELVVILPVLLLIVQQETIVLGLGDILGKLVMVLVAVRFQREL